MSFVIDQEKVLKDVKRCLEYYQQDGNYYSDRDYVPILYDRKFRIVIFNKKQESLFSMD